MGEVIGIYNENCLVTMSKLDDNSIDSIVTDPPYGLKFMGKKWDYDVPSVEIWKECLRVLKPGGYLLSFAGTRTQHRMCVNIEDAGFEIRDIIAWVYGSGFPKSLNISKAIDKQAGAERKVVGKYKPPEMEKEWNLKNAKDERTVKVFDSSRNNLDITAPTTKEAKQWEGWGTALKPAMELISVCRKPLSEKTVAANVLKWGAGGINIDGCRVKFQSPKDFKSATFGSQTDIRGNKFNTNKPSDGHIFDTNVEANIKGRFPSNFIHDGSEEVLELFPNTKSGKVKDKKESYSSESNTGFLKGVSNQNNQHGDSGSAARFFYCAKTSKKDRNEGLEQFEDKESTKRDDGQPYGMNTNKFRPDGSERKEVLPRKNNHLTVKPTKLMSYLCRLVTPVGGIIYDPFTGSGSTGKAAILEDFYFIGSELEKDYCDIAIQRCKIIQ